MNIQQITDTASAVLMTRYHKNLTEANAYQLHEAVSDACMIAIAPQWKKDQEGDMKKRHACYLSAEYLMGRMIYNNLFSMGILEEVKAQLQSKGVDFTIFEDVEDDALGNGGLGRLAACFLDSAASHDHPLFGYGLRYKYGLFKQLITDYCQKEVPDDWTKYGDPWSIRRDDLILDIQMKDLTVHAVPYDMPIIGYQEKHIGTLRLWQCESLKEIDFDLFNQQHYLKAVEEKNEAEDITKLLYPNDSLRPGKLMRIRQQYVLSCASLQDMLRTFKANFGTDYNAFADMHAIQLNDTHPTLSIPVLTRLLMEEGLSFGDAFAIARRTFRYTNHTVMQEALEKWDLDLLNDVCPETVNVIQMIQEQLVRELNEKGINETNSFNIIQDNQVHMARLAVYGSSFVNGVAKLHSQILKDDLFRNWYSIWPEKFLNETNGITQRRWLGLCNPELSALIEKRVGDDFLTDLYKLDGLKSQIDDAFAKEFMNVKQEKKRQLAAYILKHAGVAIPEHFVFDVQVKRLHEYKRQLMNAFSILSIYYGIKDGSITDFVPTAFIFGAKSAPGYDRAKAIICYINQIAALINADPEMQDKLKVVFVQNYNCSYAEKIIPAADISEQISPAGTEASGTGNMKLMLNGAVTLGTFDGANIEIVEQAGQENNYIFGATVEQLRAICNSYNPREVYERIPMLKKVVDTLADGTFEDKNGALAELKTALLDGASWHKADHYYLLLDYENYMKRKLQAIHDTKDSIAFAKKCLHNVAGAGKFSSDRTIDGYCKDIWQI